MFKSNCKPPTSILYLQNLNVDTHPKPFFGLSFLWDLFLISAFFWDQISKCILTCMPDLLSKVPSKAKQRQPGNAESCSKRQRAAAERPSICSCSCIYSQLLQVCSSMHPPIAISSLANKCMFYQCNECTVHAVRANYEITKTRSMSSDQSILVNPSINQPN